MTTPQPRPGIMSIERYIGGKSTLAGHKTIIKLSSNESALGPSPRAVAAYTAAASTLHRYPEGTSAVLRTALGKRFGLDPERIICGAGSDELIQFLVRGYAGPGDEVLYSQYGFVMYPTAALSVGATPVAAPETDHTANVDALLAKVTPRTKLCFLANPNNPTGTYLPVGEVERLRAGLRPDIVLVIDAAYAEYVARNDYSPGIELVDRGDNVVMMRTFSKLFALGGMRLGWAYCPPSILDVMDRVRGPFNVSSAAQAAGVAALEDLSHADRSRAHNDVWRRWLESELTSLGLKVTPSVGNFVLVDFAGKGGGAAANAHLNAHGIIPRALDNYGLPNHLRITIGTEAEMRAVVAALAEFL
jgi:histidinol-phosphate aminotransferase